MSLGRGGPRPRYRRTTTEVQVAEGQIGAWLSEAAATAPGGRTAIASCQSGCGGSRGESSTRRPRIACAGCGTYGP